MKIVNLSQGDDAWLDWRRSGITATDACILLGLSPYKTEWRLWAEKSGYAREVDLSLNPLVRRGRENEGKARLAYEEKHDDLLLPICAEFDANPLFRASLDGWGTAREPVEFKCPSRSVWNDVNSHGTDSTAYKLYVPQVQHQMLVTEAQRGWLVFWYEGQLKEFEILRDQELIDDLLYLGQELRQRVLDRKEPKKDPEKDLYIPEGKEVNRWISAAEEYRIYDSEIQSLKQRLKALQERQQPLLDDMKAMMGEYLHADYAGVRVTRSRVAGKVNYKQLLADKAAGIEGSEIDKYRGETTERCRVTVGDSVKPKDIIDEEVIAPLEELEDSPETSYF